MQTFGSRTTSQPLDNGSLTSQYPSRCNTEKVLCEIGHTNMLSQLSDSKCLGLKEGRGEVRKEPISVKKPPAKGPNKENAKQIDDLALKMISYTNISRSLQEKNQLIQHQKGQISKLRQCVNDIHHNRSAREAEEEFRRQQEIKRLKQLEKEYTGNLQELEGMKEHLREIKKRYETALKEKSAINNKYSLLLTENEQLTLLVQTLRTQMQSTPRNQPNYPLEEQIAQLNEQIREKQGQRQAWEQRCNNFERKVNEYVLKLNDLQATHSQHQIKYYKLQKDYDDVRMQRDQLKQETSNLTAQLEAEREIHQQEVQRLKTKLKKYEDSLHLETQKCKELRMRQSQTLTEEDSILQGYRREVAEKEERIFELQVRLKELERAMDDKKVEQDRISMKISQLENQIQQGNTFLSNHNTTLSSENRSLSSIISLQEAKITELIAKLAQLQSDSTSERDKSSRAMALFQSNIASLEAQNCRLAEELLRTRQEEGQEKKYYRDKYQRSLQQYNEMCTQLREIQNENTKLLSTNAGNAIEIGSLKAEVVGLRAQIEKLLKEQEQMTKSDQPVYDQQLLEKAMQDADHSRSEAKGLMSQLQQMRREFRQYEEKTVMLENNLKVIAADKQRTEEKLRSVSDQLEHLIQTLQTRQNQVQSYCRILQEKEHLICSIRHELQQQVEDVKSLTQTVSESELKYQKLVDHHNLEISQWQQKKQLWEEASLLEKRELQSSKLSVAYGFDSSQATVEILKRENLQLQKILGAEIERRNQTIRELITEKKKLFEQLMDRELR